MNDELDLVRKLRPEAPGPDATLVRGELETLMARISEVEPLLPRREAAEVIELGADEGERIVASGRTRSGRWRGSYRALGAAAAVALVVAGIAVLGPDGGSNRVAAPVAPSTTEAGETTADNAKPVASVADWFQAIADNDKSAAYALLGPKAKATFAAREGQGHDPALYEWSAGDFDTVFAAMVEQRSPVPMVDDRAPREEWEFLALPDDPTAGVVLVPRTAGSGARSGELFPVVRGDGGHWLLEWFAYGSQDGKAGAEMAPPPGGWDHQSPDDPVEFLGPEGDYYALLDGRAPLKALEGVGPGRYRSDLTRREMTDRDHELFVVQRGPTWFFASALVVHTDRTRTTPEPTACPSEADLAAREHKRPRRVDVTERQEPSYGLRLDPPPSGGQPRIAEEDALRRAAAYNGGAAPDPGPDPTIGLGALSDDHSSIRLNPDGSETKLIQERLSWLITYRHATVGRGGGGPGSPAGAPSTTSTSAPACTLGTVLIAVDAHSGEVLLMQTSGEDVGPSGER